MLGLEDLAIRFVNQKCVYGRDEISMVEWAIRNGKTTHGRLLRELRRDCDCVTLSALMDDHPVLRRRRFADSVRACAADNHDEIVRLAASALGLYALTELGRRQNEEANRRDHLSLWHYVLEGLAKMWHTLFGQGR